MAVDDGFAMDGIVPHAPASPVRPAGAAGSVLNGGCRARFRVFMKGARAGARSRPSSPCRPGTAHARMETVGADAGHVPVQGIMTPKSARSVHSMKHAISRDQRAKLFAASDLAGLDLDYDVSIDGISRCRRAKGVEFNKQESRAQREKLTELSRTVSDKQNDVPMAWTTNNVPTMDKGTSREKVAALRLRMKLDLPWYDGYLSEKHVQTVDIGAQSARRSAVAQRAKGQDEFYNVKLTSTADKGKYVKGHVNFKQSGGRSTLHGRGVRMQNRKVDVALRPQYTQVSNAGESGKHIAGPNFATMRSKLVGALMKDSAVPLNLQYTQIERRVRTAVAFDKQPPRPNTFLRTKGSADGPAPYDVSIDCTRPRQGAAYIWSRGAKGKAPKG